jgi:shikimate dehydrogenase
MRDQTIGGATRLVGLLGNPVAHSLSPALHNHVYATLGLPLACVPLNVSAADLHAAVQALRACGFAGANVTLPHKQAVLPFCDVVSPLSALSKTANTLYFRDNILHGTTTDFEGLLAALGCMGHNPTNGRIVILGNGGTARTFAFAFASEKIPASLTLVGRFEPKVRELAAEAAAATGFPVAFELFSSDKLPGIMRESTLCINCTPVGMHPNTDASPLNGRMLHKDITVFDTVYNPRQTLLCREAEKAGCACSGGLHMLVHQAFASIKYWTGRDIDPGIIDMDEFAALAEAGN